MEVTNVGLKRDPCSTQSKSPSLARDLRSASVVE